MGYSQILLCPIKVNSNTIELIVHNSYYCVLDLLCHSHFILSLQDQCSSSCTENEIRNPDTKTLSVYCVSPGWCKTSLHRNSHPKWYIYPLALIVASIFMKSAAKVNKTSNNIIVGNGRILGLKCFLIVIPLRAKRVGRQQI